MNTHREKTAIDDKNKKKQIKIDHKLQCGEAYEFNDLITMTKMHSLQAVEAGVLLDEELTNTTHTKKRL